MGEKIVLSDTDLDELNSDFEEDEKDVKNVKEVAGSISSVLKGRLPQPRPVTYSAKQLHGMIHMGGVNLNPDYQRDVVWGDQKMIMLIQSLFLNYYVPPVIFAKSVDDNGEERRQSIDGKQRCTAIQKFIDGVIPFVSTSTREKFWYAHSNRQKSGKPLPVALKTLFDQISIQCIEYDGIDEEKQRDIFQRVQLGMALNSSEKLAAIPGPWSKWIVGLQKRYIGSRDEDGTLAAMLDVKIERSLPFKLIASIIVLALETDRRSPPSATYITKFIDRSDGPNEVFQKRIETTFALFCNIASAHYDAAFKSCRSERVAPVEFWFIGLLIFRRMGYTPIKQLALHIGDMRKSIRALYKDVFSNSKVTNDLFEWMDNLPLVKAGRGEQAAADEWAGQDAEPGEEMRKRKRRKDEDDDSDFEGSVVGRRVESAPAKGLRSKAPTTTHKASSSSAINNNTASSSKQRPAQPVYAATRPSAPSMDAPAPLPTAVPDYGRYDPQTVAQFQQQQLRNQQFTNHLGRPPPPNTAPWGPGGYYPSIGQQQNGYR